MPHSEQITAWLTQWRQGDEQARDHLLNVVHQSCGALPRICCSVSARSYPRTECAGKRGLLASVRKPADFLPGPDSLLCPSRPNDAPDIGGSCAGGNLRGKRDGDQQQVTL